DFLIYGEDEQKAVLKNVIAALGLDPKQFAPADWVEKISYYKDTNGGARGDDFNKIFAAYNAELERLGGLDFGDIILRVINMFARAPELLEKYRGQFRYILVDEYQDTNVVQNQFLRMLAAGNICCVGDDDQSIYSWRGAEIKNILHFNRDYPDAKIIRLEENYRSTGNILGAANSLIRNNGGRLGKDLRTTAGDGEKIRLISCPSDQDEARLIADNIGDDYQNHAILIRSGSLTRLFEEELSRRSIPYKLVGAMRFYDRAEVRDVIAYARLLAHDFDDMSFARIINKPRRGIGDGTLETLRAVARKNGTSIMEALRTTPLKPKQAAAAADFLAAFDFDWEILATADAIEQLLDRAGYTKMWAESTEADAPDRRRNIRELVRGVAAKFPTLADFLENVSLMTADDGRDDTGPAVSVMTMHAAKGLEFDNVFLPAWEDGIFPNDMSISEDGLEEERRLAYVAITRAKKHCMITFAASRLLFGNWRHDAPSRFIAEIDPKFFRSNLRPMSEPRKVRPAPIKRAGRVGQTIDDPVHGFGVIIEEGENDLTIAFKACIRKIPKT
ncbi:MAG: UvrD-helicase domain-containing protein, partial [Rickettsiales bacterium]|nr:UvrD-helicase domain-containing protein [Rickettsiales bacterium]